MLKGSTQAALLAGLLLSASCAYVRHATIQADYARLQEAEPSQRNLKHMIERQNFAVIGQSTDAAALYLQDENTKAVAAFSSRFRPNELVDVMHDSGAGTHFGLDLPAGDYDVLVLSDRDRSGFYESDEVIGKSQLSLSRQNYPSMVVVQHLVELGEYSTVDWRLKLEAKRVDVSQQSLFYPAGTIRDLGDPIFSPEMSTLGLYDPAAFFERVPTLFHALEEEVGYKIPVIYVYGIGGSPREFNDLVQQLDRSRFKPWFFHYPTGGDLNQMAQLFHDIFLSGDTISLNELMPIVIVAHSMGGLIVREALNLLDTDDSKALGIEFISLATPFGGHPAARHTADSTMMILPSWRDLNPDSEFIQKLYRKPLPDDVTHELFYAFNNEDGIKVGENSDGVVPLSSQLYPRAQEQSSRQLGLDVTHTSILTDSTATTAIIEAVSQIKTGFPESHTRYVLQPGYEVNVGAIYTARDQYFLRYYGPYMEALAQGDIEPVNSWQEEFVPMLRGEAAPEFEAARAWRKYVENR